MNADNFSLKARRTTRIPLRIPVLVVMEAEGKSRSLDGWTMIVNVHGARIECKRQFGLHEEVVIQVPFNGMSQKGKVVWARSEANENGNFEIGVELDRPENLWGVGFPPSDWETARGNKRAAATSAVLELAPKEASLTTEHVASSTTVLEENRASASATVPEEMYSSAPDQLSQVLDLSDEFSGWSSNVACAEDSPLETISTEMDAIEMSLTEEETSMAMTEVVSNGAVAQHYSSKPSEAEIPQPVRGASDAQPTRAQNSSATYLDATNPTDRLSALFNEMVDAALQDKVRDLVEGLGQRMESRAADIESATLARVELRIQASVLAQSESLERRTQEFASSQQQSLEQNVQQFIAASESGVRERQQEFLGQSQTVMQNELEQLLQAGKDRLEREASELSSVTQQGLRSSMEQQLPAIEKDLLQRCVKQAEHIMAGHVEQWTLLFSDRVQQAHQAADQRLNEAGEQIAAAKLAALESQYTEMLAQADARIEQQLGRIGTQVRQAFLRHIVTELSRSQQVWIQQSQRQIERIANEALGQTRQNFSQFMKLFGESVIRQASAGEDFPADHVSIPENQTEAHESVVLSNISAEEEC